MQRTLWRLTLLQHVLFGVLTVVCIVRSALTGASPLPLVAGAGLLLGWYAAGLRLARPAPVHLGGAPGPAPHAAGARTGSRAGVGWLAGLTASWLVLVAVSPENVWIAFSLWLLAGHLLPWRWAIPYSLGVLAVVVGHPWTVAGQLTTAAIVGPAIGAAFALVVSRAQVQLVRDNLERQRLVDSLLAAQAESESLHAELSALQRAQGALDERTRLSRDIHDTLAQGFSSIVLLARSATSAAPSSPEGLRRTLEHIESTAAANLDEARRVVAALAPGDLEGAGLGAALRRLLARLEDETGIRAELRVDPELPPLPTSLEVALLRTAQGALSNVRHHARARHVVVSLETAGDSVRLDVVDDGVGFDPSVVERPGPTARGGYGILSTRSRLRELGGGLEIESAPGEGTALSAHLPVARASGSIA